MPLLSGPPEITSSTMLALSMALAIASLPDLLGFCGSGGSVAEDVLQIVGLMVLMVEVCEDAVSGAPVVWKKCSRTELVHVPAATESFSHDRAVQMLMLVF